MNIPLSGQGIPTVISSESIYKENPLPSPTLVTAANEGFVNPLSTNARSCVHEITERLITTDYIAIFEGMPFYLMTTIPTEVQSDSSSSANLPPITSNYGVGDGQMQKAWEIGFAVARTMTEQPTSFSPTPEIP